MFKVGICGHFGFGKELVNGQTDKTNAVFDALKNALGEEQVKALDTCGWQKNPLKMLSGCRRLLMDCENIIMMPSRGGVRVFPAVFQALNLPFKRRLHYVVVGGWLTEYLKENSTLISVLKKLDRIYVELEPMKAELENSGFENVIYMPNFRKTNSLNQSELIYTPSEPYPLCTFSRVMREKGIEEAIEAVRNINRKAGKTVFTLDIYGKIEPAYQERFESICKGFEPYINYRGFTNTQNSSQTLKSYFALLFPSVYTGEGFAGTIVDAFAAGVPVIATDWHYNSHIIQNGIDGIVYDPKAPDLLEKILGEAAKKPQMLNSMKPACLKRAAHFEADEAVKILLNELKETVKI